MFRGVCGRMSRLERAKRWIRHHCVGVTAALHTQERTFKLSNPWGGNINIRELSLERQLKIWGGELREKTAGGGNLCKIVGKNLRHPSSSTVGEMCNHVQVFFFFFPFLHRR